MFVDSCVYTMSLLWYLIIGPNSCRYLFTQYTYVKIYMFSMMLINMFVVFFNNGLYNSIRINFFTIRENSKLYSKDFFTFFLLPHDYFLSLFFLLITIVLPLIIIEDAAEWFFHSPNMYGPLCVYTFEDLYNPNHPVNLHLNIFFRLPKWISLNNYIG